MSPIGHVYALAVEKLGSVAEETTRPTVRDELTDLADGRAARRLRGDLEPLNGGMVLGQGVPVLGNLHEPAAAQFDDCDSHLHSTLGLILQRGALRCATVAIWIRPDVTDQPLQGLTVASHIARG